MNLTAVCTSCQKTLSVDEQHAGKKIRCPACKGIVQLPKATLTAPKKTAKSAAPDEAAAKTPPTKKRKPQEGDAERPRRPARRRPKKRAPRPARDDGDIWSAPLSSYSSPALAEEDYEEFGVAPPKRRNKAARNEGRGRQSSEDGKSPIMLCSIVCGVTLLLAIIGALVGRSSPDIGRFMIYPAIVVGFLLNAGGSLKILGNSFEEDTLVGIMYLFVPFYAVYFLFSRWDVNAVPFLISLLGTVTFVVGLVAQISIAVA